MIEAGTGAKPLVSTPCSCHYEGTLIDGTVFDSSYKRGTPSTFAPNQVIKARGWRGAQTSIGAKRRGTDTLRCYAQGWTEAMQLMPEGSKWELYIPSELACA